MNSGSWADAESDVSVQMHASTKAIAGRASALRVRERRDWGSFMAMRFPKIRFLYKVVKITNLCELAVIFANKQ